MNTPTFSFQSEPVPTLRMGRFHATGEEALEVLGDAGVSPATPTETIRKHVFDFLFTQGVEL